VRRNAGVPALSLLGEWLGLWLRRGVPPVYARNVALTVRLAKWTLIRRFRS